ncbi:Uncharacterised protein [Lelliottia amnigena]|nr:hypothetical protein CCAJJPOJ_00744 [Lelliottia sp. T2.26D-8]VDZ89769.1 Uncharacterised protein [Lelliottia amnigena]
MKDCLELSEWWQAHLDGPMPISSLFQSDLIEPQN